MIGESMDLPTQALALGYLSLSWGFGTILGEQLFCDVLLCSLLTVYSGALQNCLTSHGGSNSVHACTFW